MRYRLSVPLWAWRPLVVEGYPGNNIDEAEVDDGKSSFAANSVIGDSAA